VVPHQQGEIRVVVTVQTRESGGRWNSLVSQVTASGEVKPTTYTNITAQGFWTHHRYFW